jgi:hypothetical protein
MGMIKRETTYLCNPCPKPWPKPCHPDWWTHPSLLSGIEALDAYNRWVSEVVMPIAFQWIEEHKPDVYATVPKDMKDDVGVVIASAFQIVKKRPAYKRGLKRFAAYEAAQAEGRWDPSAINPVWTEIAKEVREATEKSFEAQAGVLKDTIR